MGAIFSLNVAREKEFFHKVKTTTQTRSFKPPPRRSNTNMLLQEEEEETKIMIRENCIYFDKERKMYYILE